MVDTPFNKLFHYIVFPSSIKSGPKKQDQSILSFFKLDVNELTSVFIAHKYE